MEISLKNLITFYSVLLKKKAKEKNVKNNKKGKDLQCYKKALILIPWDSLFLFFVYRGNLLIISRVIKKWGIEENFYGELKDFVFNT